MSLLQNSNAISAGGYDINNSLRFRSAASSYLLRTPASTTNRQTWTWSGWVKRGVLGARQHIFISANPVVNTGGQQEFQFAFNSSDQIEITGGVSGVGQDLNLTTTQVFRDPSAWYHFVILMDTTQATSSNRMKFYLNGVQVTAFGTAIYPAQNHNTAVNLINFSHRIGGSGGSYLDAYQAEVNFIDGQALTPSSFGETDAVTGSWVAKKYTGTYGTNGFYLKFANDSSSLSLQYGALLNGSTQHVSLTPTSAFNFSNNNWTIESFIWPNSQTTQVIFNYGYEGSTNRSMVIYYNGGNLNLAYSTNGSNNTDTSFGAHNMILNTWYHVAVVRNGTTITAYINGIPLPTTITIGTSSIHYPGTSGAFRIGRDSTNYLNAYIHGFRIVNGTAVYTSKFKPTTTKLTAIANTQLLTLQDSTLIDNSPNNFTLTNNGSFTIYYGVVPYAAPSIAADYSGNINNWLLGTGWNVNDITDQSYGVMYDSPTLTSATVGNYAVFNPLWKASNLTLAGANLNVTSSGNGGTAISTIAMPSGKWYCEVTVNTGSDATTIGICNNSFNPTTTTLTSSNAVGYYGNNGDKFVNGTQSAYGASYTTGNIIGIALDVDAGTVTFYKNNTSQGAITHGLTGPFYFATSDASSTSNIDQSWNFGQRPFIYTPPTGYNRLNTYNLPDSTIKKGNRYMDATLYTGTGTSLVTVNAGQFKPDMVWFKARSNAYNHELYDSVRGVQKRLSPNLTNAESTSTLALTSFNNNGFTQGGEIETGGNGVTLVAWQWQAGQGSTSTNTNGTITSTVSVNTTAGFSIVTYTGVGSVRTVGHGLGVAPKFIIAKSRNNIDNWPVGTSALGWDRHLLLNLTSAVAVTSSTWSDTAPTSSVFTVGTDNRINASGWTYVAYCFAEIAGFSKFGSYTGNGSADGPFIYTGFRPTFIIRKQSSGIGDWIIFDNARNPYNVETTRLLANTSNGDQSPGNNIDVLSNGWKERSSDGYSNASGQTYIYMAFAENPFKNSNAR